jgi:nucleoside diphosphate kinase
VLVTPDGLVTESLPWLVEKLRSAGLEPVVGRLIRLESATMLRVYNPSARTRQPDLPSNRAFDLWYSLGPGCILALHYGELGACDALLAVKGATNPTAASPDSIRYRGENGLVNLVHCPDDEIAAAEELAMLLGTTSAQDMQQLAMAPNDPVRYLTIDLLADALPVSSGSTALSLPLVVNRIRLRLMQQAAFEAASTESALSALVEIASALRDGQQEIAKMTTSSDRAHVAQALDGQVHGRLLSMAQLIQNAALERSLHGLRALLMGSEEDWPGTLRAFEANGTYISPAESAVLEISTYL